MKKVSQFFEFRRFWIPPGGGENPNFKIQVLRGAATPRGNFDGDLTAQGQSKDGLGRMYNLGFPKFAEMDSPRRGGAKFPEN